MPNTSSCSPPPPEGTSHGGKYRLNANFASQMTPEGHKESHKDEIIPTVLQDHEWETRSMGDNAGLQNVLSGLEDPFANTVERHTANGQADWMKYDLDVHRGNVQKLGVSDSPYKDTFAKKKGDRGLNSSHGLSQIKGILNDPLTNSNGNSNSNTNNNNNSSVYSSSAMANGTSDAEEFESMISIQQQLNQGENIIEQLRQQPLQYQQQTQSSSVSDYTQDDDYSTDFQKSIDLRSGLPTPPITQAATASPAATTMSSATVPAKANAENDSAKELQRLMQIVQFTPISIPQVKQPRLKKTDSYEVIQESTPNRNSEHGVGAVQVAPGIMATPAPGHRNLKFINGEDFNMVWDKQKGMFVHKESESPLNAVGDMDDSDLFDFSQQVNSNNNRGTRQQPTMTLDQARKYSLPNHDSNSHNTFSSFTSIANSSFDTNTNSQTAEEEVSFSVSNSALVSAISDAYPEEDWETVEELNISNYSLDKLLGLDQFVPKVWLLDASDNAISQYFGIPANIQVLIMNDNHFGAQSTQFNLTRLQSLQMKNNKLTNLDILSSLTQLTSLDLSGNSISNISSLKKLRMLRYLNLNSNKLSSKIDFSEYQLWFLEELFLDDNAITQLANLIQLPHLTNLSAKRNKITSVNFGKGYHSNLRQVHLRKLVLNQNRLKEIDLVAFPKLKEIRLDKNVSLITMRNIPPFISRISSMFVSAKVVEEILDNASNNVNLQLLNLTGSRLPRSLDLKHARGNCITHLDLAWAKLSELPANFSKLFPLLVDINLNFNGLANIRGLNGLSHLRQVKLFGNSLQQMEDVCHGTESSRMSIQMLDLRSNPISEGFHPYIFDSSPDDMDAVGEDDIERYHIEYSNHFANLDDWHDKSQLFDQTLDSRVLDSKREYCRLLSLWLPQLAVLDGNSQF